MSEHFLNATTSTPSTLMEMNTTGGNSDGSTYCYPSYFNMACLENLTTTVFAEKPIGTFDRLVENLPVIGYPGPLFSAIHLAALTSLSISTLVSIALIIGLCCWRESTKKPRTVYQNGNVDKGPSVGRSLDDPTSGLPPKLAKMASVPNPVRQPAAQQAVRESFWKWNIGERLVIYLAISDLLMSIAHLMDHSYMYHTKSNPPDKVCSAFAFVLQEFTISQWITVLYTAFSAATLIVFNKKLNIGRYDWRLIFSAFGLPAILGAIDLRLGLLGQNGAWCHIDFRTVAGQRYGQFFSALQILFFGVIGLSYGAILVTIRKTVKRIDSNTDRYRGTARVMMIFVAIFVLQWWSLSLFFVWQIFSPPPPPVLMLPVSLINLGGVYNCIAYTIIRYRLRQQAASGGPKSVGQNGGHQQQQQPVAASTTTMNEYL